MELSEALPGGWRVWNAESGGRVVFAYRPDVFDADAFDAACLPTITVAPGRSPDRPPTHRSRAEGWHVALYLEPEVRVEAGIASAGERDAAIDAAVETAAAFAAGEIEYRDAYRQPREAYLDRLDALTGGG